MSTSINEFEFMGNVSKKAMEVKTLTTGKKVLNFDICTNRFNGEKDWHKCVAWDKTAETIAQYVHGGDLVLIKGYVVERKYERDGSGGFTKEDVRDAIESHMIDPVREKTGSDDWSNWLRSQIEGVLGALNGGDKVTVKTTEFHVRSVHLLPQKDRTQSAYSEDDVPPPPVD